MLSARCQPFCSELNVIMALSLDQCQQDAAYLLLPVTHLTNDLWHHRWRFFFAVIFILMMQPGHEFAHVTTALLSWHVQNYVLVRSLFFTKSNTIFFQDLDYELINCLWHGSSDHANPSWQPCHLISSCYFDGAGSCLALIHDIIWNMFMLGRHEIFCWFLPNFR